MNKKMRELLSTIESKRKEARGFQDSGDTEKAAATLTEMEILLAQYEVEEKLFKAEQEDFGEKDFQPAEKSKKDGFETIVKVLHNKPLEDTEKALVTGGASGENNLMPEDVDLTIREMRKSYNSAKELVTVIPTDTMSGGFNFEKGTPTGLVNLTDGDDIDATGGPEFERKSFAIKLYSKLIPVSKVLGKAERAGLMSYINKWFVKNAIITENQKIFAALKDGITPATYLTFDQLKTAAQTGLDTSVWFDGVIATNQSGYNHLSLLKSEDGKYLMQPLITEPTKKGIDINGTIVPVKVFDNKFLPDVGGKAPIFFGSTKAGCYMVELGSTEFNSDDSYLFGKNQKALMILEGFDVIGADKDAYNYGLLDINTYDVTFTVKIGTTAQEGVVVECNGLTGTTNSSGVAVLKLTNGVFNYTAKGTAIKDFAGKVNVAGANVSVAVAATAAE